MYQIKKALTMQSYDLFVNGILILRDKKHIVNEFVRKNVKPLGLELIS